MNAIDAKNATNAILESKSIKEEGYKPLIVSLFSGQKSNGIQNIHTPFDLCIEICNKLNQFKNIKKQKICVLFNIEFVEVLINDFNVNPENITFFPDSKLKYFAASKWYKKIQITNIIRVATKEELKIQGDKIIMPKIKKQFDVVLMNPPYQAPKDLSKEGNKKSGTRGGDLWSKFVKLSMQLAKDDGYIANVHPAAWRKPEHELFNVVNQLNFLYLEMHNEKDGKKTFGATTSYDWYIVKNKKSNDATQVLDACGEQANIKLSNLPFLPSSNLDLISKIIAKDKESRCKVLFSYSLYETRQEWMSSVESDKFQYPCIHSMTKDGLVYWYSSKKGEFFDVPKVILSFGRHQYPVNDYNGKYGMTQISFGLKVENKEEGEKIVAAINSSKFQDILKATKWSSFQTDWRMFKYFKKDFWKEFV